MRHGEVIRIYPHGTVMIWDMRRERSYPFYGDTALHIGEGVLFATDADDKIVVRVERLARGSKEQLR